MSAQPSDAIIVSHRPGKFGGLLNHYAKGSCGNPAGVSKERHALNRAIEQVEIPKVHALLEAIYVRAMSGDMFAAKMWLDQVRGPVKPRKDAEEIESAIELKLMELISTAKAARQQQP